MCTSQNVDRGSSEFPLPIANLLMLELNKLTFELNRQ